jgi:hypothetical protein
MAEQTNYLYDGFISYSHSDADREWVWRTLLPRLEQADLRVCIDDNDFEIGVPRLVNIERAVDRSRYTMVVLTPEWIKSEWAEFESLLIGTVDQVAHKERILLLVLRLCDIPAPMLGLYHVDLTQLNGYADRLNSILQRLQSTVFAPGQDEIDHQQNLLATHRRTLRVWFQQKANYSFATPPYVLEAIRQDRAAIRRIKEILRSWGIHVEDYPDDEAPITSAQAIVERVDSFMVGMSALRDLLGVPAVRDAAVTFRIILQGTYEQIDVLGAYKSLHDLLHDLQFLWYDIVTQEARRFPTDDNACEDLRRYTLKLEEIIDGLQEITPKVPFVASEAAWTRDLLVRAQKEFDSAIESADAAQLKKTIWRVGRVLNLQPTQINVHLIHAARGLRLPALVQALTHLRDNLSLFKLDPEKVRLFEVGVAALAGLNDDLAIMVDDHDQWQAVDCELRRIEDHLEQNIKELFWSWPDLKIRMESLYDASIEPWALLLKADGEKLTDAIATEDFTRIKQYFRRYRSRAGHRFHRVDKKLKELCNVLRQVDGPLASVVSILS